MKILLYLSISVALSVFLLPPVSADNSINIVCAEWPGFTNQDGTGLYWELVKEVYEPLGFKVHTKIVPWKRAGLMIERKIADALVGDYYYSQKDGKERLYPKWHLSVEDPLLAIFKKELHEIEGFDSLSGKSIICMRGYDFDKIYLKDIQHEMHQVDSVKKGLSLIKNDRYDVFLDYRYNMKNAYRESDIDLLIFKTVVMKVGNKLFLNFSNTENSKRLIKIYDQRIPELLDNGKLEEICKKNNSNIDKFGPHRYNNSKK
ncbi:transporter substrate-binding domain-containing protein [Desulfobacterales bacterium HSG17]|nr:transporter substrate-binding domain-containing protein [Desulfobacterales bacterium HSG17]